MTVAVISGKFYPPHKGHAHLIDSALVCADEVYGILVYTPGEEPNGAMRLDWLKKMAPGVKWTIVENVVDKENDSDFWAEYTIRTLANDFDFVGEINYVVTSESYGINWARHLNCDHIQVDMERTLYPISGTVVMSNPVIYWDYLTAESKAYYAHRICLVGGESTGKSTLARKVAEHFHTLWVPEIKSIDNSTLLDHVSLENHLASQCHNGILICDTDLLTASVWYKNYVGDEQDEIYQHILKNYHANSDLRWSNRPYDHYLVLTPEVGQPEDEEKRQLYHRELLAAVKETGVPYTLIEGSSFKMRTAAALFDVVGTMNQRTQASEYVSG